MSSLSGGTGSGMLILPFVFISDSTFFWVVSFSLGGTLLLAPIATTSADEIDHIGSEIFQNIVRV